MRKIEESGQFRRDLKRELKGRHGATLRDDLRHVANELARDAPLPAQYQDHRLTGNWRDHRDCHLKPDLVLIYAKPEGILRLVRLGSRSEIFG